MSIKCTSLQLCHIAGNCIRSYMLLHVALQSMMFICHSSWLRCACPDAKLSLTFWHPTKLGLCPSSRTIASMHALRLLHFACIQLTFQPDSTHHGASLSHSAADIAGDTCMEELCYTDNGKTCHQGPDSWCRSHHRCGLRQRWCRQVNNGRSVP